MRPDLPLYGWKSVDGIWEPMCLEGKLYPDSIEQGKSEVEGVKPGDRNEGNKDDDDSNDRDSN